MNLFPASFPPLLSRRIHIRTHCREWFHLLDLSPLHSPPLLPSRLRPCSSLPRHTFKRTDPGFVPLRSPPLPLFVPPYSTASTIGPIQDRPLILLRNLLRDFFFPPHFTAPPFRWAYSMNSNVSLALCWRLQRPVATLRLLRARGAPNPFLPTTNDLSCCLGHLRMRASIIRQDFSTQPGIPFLPS